MRRALLLTCFCAVVVLAGCGQSANPPGPGPDATANRAARRLLSPGLSSLPTPGPTHRPASTDAIRVIRAWSTALRTGHVKAAAGWFATPSEFVNGVGPGGTVPAVRLDSLRAAIVANETLPCGAKFVSADQRGRYVNALFTLTGRSGPGGQACGGGSGQTARTNFLIVDGRIVEWIRAPDDPGDNGSAGPGGGGSGGGGSGGGGSGGGGSGGGGANPGGPRQGNRTAPGPLV